MNPTWPEEVARLREFLSRENPPIDGFLAHVGGILFSLGFLQAARSVMEAAIQFSPRSGQARYNLIEYLQAWVKDTANPQGPLEWRSPPSSVNSTQMEVHERIIQHMKDTIARAAKGGR